MGAIIPALPWIAKGAGALFGGLLGRKAQKSAMQRSPEEQLALGGAQQAAGQIGQTGQTLLDTGLPLQQQAAGYYQTLLRGNRGAMAQATAAPTAAITDIYRGAERNLDRTGVQGAARDVASADLGRQRASQLAGLVTGVQPGAASALAGMGGQLTGQGVGAQGAAAGVYSGLLGQGFQNRVYGREEGEKAGGGIGGFIFDLLNTSFGKRGGGLVPLPSRQTMPNTGWLPGVQTTGPMPGILGFR